LKGFSTLFYSGRTMAKRKFIDWDSIKPLWCSGMSNCEISRQYAADHVHSQTYRQTVTEAAIRKQAKAKKWQRNIANKVKDRVREKLVRSEVRTSNKKGMSEDELIEAAAEKPVAVRMLQRGRAQELAQTGDDLQQGINYQLDKWRDEKTGKVILPFIQMYEVVKTYAKLVAARKNLQEMESDAFGLNDKDDQGKKRIRITRFKEDAD